MGRRYRRSPASANVGAGGAIFIACGLGGLLYAIIKFNSCLDDVHRDMEISAANRHAEEERSRAAYAAEDDRREREREEAKRKKAALDAEERGLAPDVRTARVRGLLPDICAAKVLLGKATDSKIAALAQARELVRAAEQKQLLAERSDFEKSRGLTCADGTSSATCSCYGNHQGCCSHHHGVAGCDPYPTEISCP